MGLLAIRALAEGFHPHVDGLFGVCPPLKDLVEGDGEFQLLAGGDQTFEGLGGALARGRRLHQVQTTQDSNQPLVCGNGAIGSQPEDIGSTGRPENGQVVHDLTRGPQVIPEDLQVHSVGLLENVLQVLLERQGCRAELVETRNAGLANTGLQVGGNLLSLTHAGLVPIAVHGTQRLHGGLGLLLRHVAHEHDDRPLFQQARVLERGRGKRRANLDVGEQAANEVRLLTHGEDPRAGVGGAAHEGPWSNCGEGSGSPVDQGSENGPGPTRRRWTQPQQQPWQPHDERLCARTYAGSWPPHAQPWPFACGSAWLWPYGAPCACAGSGA